MYQAVNSGDNKGQNHLLASPTMGDIPLGELENRMKMRNTAPQKLDIFELI